MLERFIVPAFIILVSRSAAAEEPKVEEYGGILGDSSTKPINQKDSVRTALANNPALASLIAEARSAEWSVTAEENRYQFVLGANASYVQSHTPRLEASDTISSNLTRSWMAGADLSRQFSIGTEVELRLQNEYFQNEFGGGFTNPTLNQSNGFGSTVKLSLKQPLLRGAGLRNGEFDLRVARASLSEADSARRLEASSLVRDTLLAYGEFWYAAQAVAIERASLSRTQKHHEEAQAKVRTGTLSAADALSFATRVAEGREAVVAAQAELQRCALEFQRLLGKSSSSEVLVPSEAPTRFRVPSLNEIEQALEAGSVELSTLEARLESARVQERLAGESLRPRLDASASIQTTGLGETPASALGRTFEFGWVTGMVTLEFESPLGSKRRHAELEQAREKVLAARGNLEEARNRIATDAKQAQVRLLAAQRSLAFAEETRQIAEQTLDSELKRYLTGTGVGVQVREAVDAVRRAHLREVRARVDVSSEEINLQHLSGGLLQEAERLQLL